jgi:glycyl-tRNA synthetase
MTAAGVPAEATRAILAERGDDPALAVESAKQLAHELQAGDASQLPAVLTALSRPTRLVRGKDVAASDNVNEALFDSDEERALWAAYEKMAANIVEGMSIKAWLEEAAKLGQPVDAFFTNVLVMTEDNAIKANRLALVQRVASVSNGILDFE